MKKIITVLLLVLVIASLPLVTCAMEESVPSGVSTTDTPAGFVEQKKDGDKITGEFAASALSAYIWRGQELTRHSVVIQPSLTVAYNGFTANLWGNIDTKPYSVSGEGYSSQFSETDVTLSYSHKFGMIQAGAGYIYYGLAAAVPGGIDLPDSQEIFVTLGLDTVFAPTLTIYKEIDHYRQWYATFGISHTFALHEKIGLKLTATASYLLSTDETAYPKFDGDSLATTDKFSNFHDGVVGVALPVAITGHITVIPTMTYVFPLSDDARYEMKARSLKGATYPSDKDGAFLYGGVVLSFAF